MSRLKLLNNLRDKVFTKYLVVTNVTVGGGFMGLADLIQQTVEKKIIYEKPYDFQRTGRMVFGGFCFGFLGSGWYKFLDRKFPGTARKAIVKKLLCEMALGPPLVLGFFMTVGLAEKKTIKKSFEGFTDNFISICAMDWLFYTPMQYFNFLYLQPRYRFVYVSAITVVYDIFLSYIVNKDKLIKPDEEKVLGSSTESTQ